MDHRFVVPTTPAKGLNPKPVRRVWCYMALAQAWEKAREWEAIRKAGIDPREKEQRAPVPRPDFEALAEAYLHTTRQWIGERSRISWTEGCIPARRILRCLFIPTLSRRR
jgi:hypothetical protein